MPESNSPLDNLHIASPCHADWDKMTGDNKARFCQTCQKNVFNLSMMTRTEAEQLIRRREGNLCVQYAQREDGTIITNDCPIGMEKVKMVAVRPWRFLVASVASLVAALCGAVGITPTFALPPTNPVAHCKVTKGDVAPETKTPVKVLRGEPVACPPPPKSEAKVIKMGKPVTSSPNVTILQGGAVPPLPTPPPVFMGKIAAPKNKTQVKTLGKPVVKKAPQKKSTTTKR